MDIFDSLKRIQVFLSKPIDEEIFFDKGNTPFISITLVYLINGVTKELSYGTFLTLKVNEDENKEKEKKAKRKLLPSNYQQEACVGLSKEIQAAYIETCLITNNDPDPFITDDGICDSIWLNQETRAIISVIASPQDTDHCFRIVKNQLEIIFDSI